MNQQLKSILLTVLTLSVFTIAIVELSGVSKTALINKYGIGGKKPMTETAVAALPRTKMVFEDTLYHFGVINEGDQVTKVFKFRNEGGNPLIISNASASCGCTVPTFPKDPIAPGATGEISVTFNSNGKAGHQRKNVIVYSNAELEATSIGFDAEVTPKK